MPRAVKCQQCDIKETFDESTFTVVEKESDSGRKTRKYFHNECLNKYIQEEQEKDREKESLDRLVEVAGQIHDAPKPPNLAHQMPRDWYHYIQDWRNGTQRYTRGFKKKFKQGIPYDVIADAYKLSRDGIKWSKMDKQFKDFKSEVRYGLAIVNNKIPDALKKAERDKHMERVKEAREREELENMKYERETVFQKKKADYDISDLLD